VCSTNVYEDEPYPETFLMNISTRLWLVQGRYISVSHDGLVLGTSLTPVSPHPWFISWLGSSYYQIRVSKRILFPLDEWILFWTCMQASRFFVKIKWIWKIFIRSAGNEWAKKLRRIPPFRISLFNLFKQFARFCELKSCTEMLYSDQQVIKNQ
jgi:hypothetical protein